jgi:hypothetical protein
MKTSLAAPLLALVFPALATFSLAAEKLQQLRVSLTYTRDAKILRLLGPENFERGRLTFTLSAQQEILAQEGSRDDHPNSAWPGLLPTASVGPATAAARLKSEITVDQPPVSQPARTTADYTGTLAPDTFYFGGMEPAWPFVDGYDTTLNCDILLKGACTGVAPGLPSNGGVSITDAPVSYEGEQDLLCRAEFKIFSAPGPRPADQDAARLHEIKSLNQALSEVYASTAPKSVWVGAKTEKLPDGGWRFSYEGTITWPMGDGGETTDTLKITVTPVSRTLPAPNPDE